ncbi:hypothetical protein HYALB_00013740 [Hymenoscyphus albidus]|uniref:Cytochrome P450 n=1 Tax=Hymenoscyphus albidus TaxID=595503 RepID=A0A9N9LV97_9HELO|nr:hypothetical protein HYALB_00013740 [Hymenoscyphus albidus]
MTPFMRNNVDFESISRDEILATFNFVIIGGSESSATALTGIFNHLSRKENRDILGTLCADIRVISEGLRLCNPVPGGLPRVVPEGGDTYCGIFLPEGTRLEARNFAINRSQKYFDNPDKLSASKPFTSGFHCCLGRPLAMLELRLVIIKVLLAFDVSVDSADSVNFDDFPVIMLIQKLPMVLRLKSRDVGIEVV